MAGHGLTISIDFFETSQTVVDRLISIITPIAQRHNLTFSVLGSAPGIDQNVIKLESWGITIEPAPLTPDHGPAFELMGGTIRHLFPDTVIAPSAMVAFTDTQCGSSSVVEATCLLTLWQTIGMCRRTFIALSLPRWSKYTISTRSTKGYTLMLTCRPLDSSTNFSRIRSGGKHCSFRITCRGCAAPSERPVERCMHIVP